MLDLGPYLLGVAQVLALAGLAGLGGAAARRRLVPELSGASATLAATVLALSLLVFAAEVLGAFGLFEPLPHLLLVGAMALAAHRRWPPPERTSGRRLLGIDGLGIYAAFLAVLLLAGMADDVHQRLDTGMTGFDSTWYHAPFAAGFFQSGDTWGLHHIAPQFLAWFYPANGEIFHAIGMNAFGRDLVSPWLNVAWMLGCLFAAWCIGRPFRCGWLSAMLVFFVLIVPALADQAGEARNDVVGLFFLLASVAIALAAATDEAGRQRSLSIGAVAVAGLSAGLAAGTKLNLLMPAAVLVLGMAAIAPVGRKPRFMGAALAGALAGGGYWYLRNLAHTGNPLPWFDDLGPLSLPAPSQELGGREQHSVLGYLTDGSVWSDWLLPGLHHGLGGLWPLLLGLAALGIGLGLGPRAAPMARVAALAALAAALAWLVAPTSASGPAGAPHGFESGLRYLVPALALGAALLAVSPSLLARLKVGPAWERPWQPPLPRWGSAAVACLLLAVAIAAGYLVQREYLRDRYAHPSFTTPGLDAAFEWATPISGARIATTSTRQYPLFGTDLSNRVEFMGEERPHGGFVPPATCRAWRRLLAEGDYDYVVASRDRIEPGKPPYPETARWTEGPGATVVLRKPPTVVFRLSGQLDASSCSS